MIGSLAAEGMVGKTVSELEPGDAAELSRRIQAEDIEQYVAVSGDRNPIHSDPEFAARTSFKEPIAPGMLTAGLISAVIGTYLPGPGAIYLSQTLKFLKPVKAGDTITARAEVLEVIRERNRVRLATVCRNQLGEEVLTGEAWVMPSRVPITYDRGPGGLLPPVTLLWQPLMWGTRAFSLWGTLGLSLLAASLERRKPALEDRRGLDGPTSRGRR
jgi:3-hydroxybutyryl-CoA dehydratase